MRAVNLIPVEQREGSGSLTGRSEGAALMVLALIAGLAILAVLYGKARHAESTSKGELTTVNAELSAARAQAGRLAPYTSFVAMANQRVQTVNGLVASRFDWSHAFNELGRVLPGGVMLTTLHGQVGGSGPGGGSASTPAPTASATPASATPPGATPTFTLTGCTASQTLVAQTLQRLRLIDGVTAVTLQSSVKQAEGSTTSSGVAASSNSSNGCPKQAAVFSAQISFEALPSAPATNAPGATPAASARAASGTQTSGGAVSVASQGGSSK